MTGTAPESEDPSRIGGGETNAGEVGSPMNRHPKTFSKKDSARSKLATLICVKAKAEVGFEGWGEEGSGVREDDRRDLEVGESGREAEERERRAFIAARIERIRGREGGDVRCYVVAGS